MACIMNGATFALDSTGNGAFYLLRHKKAKRSTFFQGDDAVRFEENLEGTEFAFPDESIDFVLRWLWDQCGYGAASQPDEKESDVA